MALEIKVIIIDGAQFRLMQCGNCGVFHAFPEEKYEVAYREGGYWWCPNGHQRGWREGAEKAEINQLRRERDLLKQREARLEEESREAWAAAEEQNRLRIAADRKLKAAQARIGAGVCPCCNRTFSQLARHMQTKHPEVPFVPSTKATRAK